MTPRRRAMSLLLAALVGVSGITVACGDDGEDTEQDGGQNGGGGESEDDGDY